MKNRNVLENHHFHIMLLPGNSYCFFKHYKYIHFIKLLHYSFLICFNFLSYTSLCTIDFSYLNLQYILLNCIMSSSKQPSIQKVLCPTTRPSSTSSSSKSSGTKLPNMGQVFGIRRN
jgi:hypothetical protein